jgi:hypothetical protein
MTTNLRILVNASAFRAINGFDKDPFYSVKELDERALEYLNTHDALHHLTGSY